MTKAILLDRDGTIIEAVPGYITAIEQMRLIPGAAEAIGRLNHAGYTVIVASNQSAIGRGFLSWETWHEMGEWLNQQIAGAGAHIERFYVCPHLPEDHCECRKPQPGMLLDAARDFDIDLPSTFMVGDKLDDAMAGSNAGCKSILVLTGETKRAPVDMPKTWSVCDDLAAASRFVVGEQR